MARILIVEDSPTQAEQLSLILEAAGFAAEVAIDAESALARLTALSFDMVISDVVMPQQSGYDLCRKIKAEPAWSNIPVILLTTRKDPMDIFKGLECGADNFYTKPYDPVRLIERIRNILYNRALRTEGKLKVGVEIAFFGKTFTIGSEKEQILDLLISTFEDTVQANLDLERKKGELDAAKATLEDYARLLEGKVRSSEERYRAIVEGITEGIITVDEQGKITSVNPAIEAAFGYSGDEASGKDIRLLIPEPRKGRSSSSIASYLRGGTDREVGELTGRRKDGTAFPLELSVSEVIIDDHRMFIIAAADITTRKATEQQLRQAQKMEAVGQLAGGIAHDFNNNLSVILGSLDLLKDQIPTDPPTTRLMETALRATDSAADLTRRLLAFSHQQVLEFKICDIGALVAGMDEMLRRTLGQSIEIKTVTPAGQLLCRIDESEFQNALLNLAINARDAMPGGGKLTIELGATYLNEDYAVRHGDLHPGDFIVVAVSDTGTGIPDHVLERVFEPFFTTKGKDKGTGLGLSMVYGFIKQSGGHINVNTKEGHGTTVTMYLPLLAEKGLPRQDERRDTVAPTALEKLSVLIVDDDDDVREIGVSMLRQLGCRVTEARNAAQALSLLDNHDDIGILFTDVVMPGGMNGIALASEAKRRRSGLRVMLCSGYADAAAVKGQGMTEGSVFLNKPYRKEQLARKLELVLDASE